MNTKLNKIFAEISAGELIDKITILEIKKVKIKNKDKLKEIEKELLSLNETMGKSISDNSKISKFKDSLLEYGGYAKYILNESKMKKQIQDIMLNSKLVKIKKPFNKKFINQAGYLYGKS